MLGYIKKVMTALLAIWLTTSAATASEPFWHSEPGLCDADDGVIEEKDVIILTKTGIDSHFFGCTWPSKAGEELLREKLWVNTKAKCSNATGTWEAVFEIVQQGDGSVRVFQESGGISPVRFFRCG